MKALGEFIRGFGVGFPQYVVFCSKETTEREAQMYCMFKISPST